MFEGLRLESNNFVTDIKKMTTLSLKKKKKICALAVLTVMLDENVNVSTGRIFWVKKIFQEKKKYDLYHILTDIN